MKLGILTSYSCINGKEMYKKVCCTCKVVVCLLNLWLLWSSRCRRRRLILRYLFCFTRWRNKIEPNSLREWMYSRWQPRSQVLSRQSMLWCQYSQKSPGYKSESGYVSYTCGRANLIWTRIRMDVKFLNPERNSCGFKNIRIRVDTFVDTCVDTRASHTVITQNMFHWFYIHNLQKQANKTKKQFHVILVYVSITISKFQQSPSSDLTTLHVEPTEQLDLF